MDIRYSGLVAVHAIAFLTMLAGQPATVFTEKNLQATCGTCHPLDPVKEAKLSHADWIREVDKMEAMGAKIKNRKLLLTYLSAHYGRKNKN